MWAVMLLQGPGVHWGAINGWIVVGFTVFVGVGVPALIYRMRNDFVGTEKHKQEIAQLTGTVERLERDLTVKVDDFRRAFDRSQDRHEQIYVSRQEFNGVTARLNQFAESLAEVRTESRAGFDLARVASGDVKHLASRLEDSIQSGVEELKKQLEEINRWRMEELRRQRNGGN